MRFTIFQESPEGLAQGQPGPDRVHVQPRHAAARRRRRHGRARGRRDRRADRRAAVHRALPAGGEADPQESAQVPAGLDAARARGARARTRTSSRCSRRRARPASRCIVQASHAYWAHVGDSRLYLYRQGGLIGADEGPFEGPVPRRPGHHRRRRRGRASRPQQDLQLPRRSRRSGDRSWASARRCATATCIVMCTDGLWSVLTREEIATWLTSTPILKIGAADDARGREARRPRRRQPVRRSSCAGARRR